MLSIVLYVAGPPPCMDLDFSSFLRGEHTEMVPQRKILFRKGTISYNIVAVEKMTAMGVNIKATSELKLNNSPEINWTALPKTNKKNPANCHQENCKTINLSRLLDLKDSYWYIYFRGKHRKQCK